MPRTYATLDPQTGQVPNGQLPPASQGSPPGHPDLTEHVALGLAQTHSHPFAADVHTHAHNHDGVYEVIHSHPYAATAHNHDAAYATAGHTHAGGSGPSMVKLTAPQVAAVTAFANITGFTRALVVGEYCYWKALLVYRANATTTGIRLGVNGPAAPAVLAYRVSSSRANAAASAAGAVDNEATFVAQTYDAPAADSGVAAANTDYIATIEGVIQNGPNAGTLAMRFASEVAVANGITLRPGSHVMFWSI